MNHIMETLRRLGIDQACREAKTFLAVCYGRLKVEELTEKQIQEVRYVWNSRNYIPEDKWNGIDSENVSYVKPPHEAGEEPDEFSKEYIANIVEFINNPDDSRWKEKRKK